MSEEIHGIIIPAPGVSIKKATKSPPAIYAGWGDFVAV
jgi:hypothetical protein